MTPSAARRHGTVDLSGEKGQQPPAGKSQQDGNTMELVMEASKKLSMATGGSSDTEDEDEDGVDPAERERERKSSEQRIIAIVHSTPPPQEEAAFEPGEEEFLDSLVAAAMSGDYRGDKATASQIQNAINHPSAENQIR